MSKKKNTTKVLENLKAKRAKFAAGGYGYGTSRKRSDSVAIKSQPKTKPKAGPKPKPSKPVVDPESLYSDPYMGGNEPKPQPKTVAPKPEPTVPPQFTRSVEPSGGTGGERLTNGGYGTSGGSTNTNGGYGTSGGTAGERLTGGTGLDGNTYSTDAALNAANARYSNEQAAKTATFTSQGITKEAPTGITQTAPVANLRQMESTNIDPLSGITGRSSGQGTGYAVQKLGDAKDATADTVTAQQMKTARGYAKTADVELGDGTAESYEAATAGRLDPTKAAEGKVSQTGDASQARATEAKETGRDDVAEEAAMGTAVKRDPDLIGKEYATAQAKMTKPMKLILQL